MYPAWLEAVSRHCICGASLTPDHVVAVGVSRPDEQHVWAGPLALAILKCPTCGERQIATIDAPLEAIQEALQMFHNDIAEAAKKVPPPIQFPRSHYKGNGEPSRPSLRADQPITPPTQREITAFLIRMRRTPFKPGGKAFQIWLNDLGADQPDNGDGTNDNNK